MGEASPPTIADRFVDCRLSQLEGATLATAMVLGFVVQLTPVMNSALSGYVVAALAIVCWLTPLTAFFFVAWSQSFPTVTLVGLNPAQLGFALWIPVTLVRHGRLRLAGFGMTWPLVVMFVWLSITSDPQMGVFSPSTYVLALCYIAVACQSANEARGAYLKCLLGLSLGAWMVGSAFWAQVAGLPVDLSDYGAVREGFARLGGIGTDSVMVWPAVLLGSFGILGIAVAQVARPQPSPGARLGLAGAVLLLLMSLPLLSASMTRGAYLCMAAMVGATVLATSWAVRRLKDQPAARSRLLRTLSAAMIAFASMALVMWTTDTLGFRTRANALWTEYVHRSYGSAASRDDVWSYAIDTIRTYPLFGVTLAGGVESLPPGMSYYLSHNVFLDIGRAAGIPGMAWMAFVFFYPVVQFVRRVSIVAGLGFVLAYGVMFFFWMSLSFVGYKTFWALWMLTAATARAFGPREPMEQKGPVRQVRERGGLSVTKRGPVVSVVHRSRHETSEPAATREPSYHGARRGPRGV